MRPNPTLRPGAGEREREIHGYRESRDLFSASLSAATHSHPDAGNILTDLPSPSMTHGRNVLPLFTRLSGPFSSPCFPPNTNPPALDLLNERDPLLAQELNNAFPSLSLTPLIALVSLRAHTVCQKGQAKDELKTIETTQKYE